MLKKLCCVLLSILLTACSAHYANKNPTGETFPSVEGQTLEKIQVELPAHFTDRHVVLLLGYVQNAQFDIDRWLIGLDMTKTQIDVYEIPTIAGMFPRFFQTQIDDGMRSGIPKELWKGVITVYKGGDKIQSFTGNENPNNARVILLSKTGQVIFFHDRGFSVDALKQLRNAMQ